MAVRGGTKRLRWPERTPFSTSVRTRASTFLRTMLLCTLSIYLKTYRISSPQGGMGCWDAWPVLYWPYLARP